MADLLGSILSSMEKPPTVGDQESRRKARGTLHRPDPGVGLGLPEMFIGVADICFYAY